jgi:hypothetical protein
MIAQAILNLGYTGAFAVYADGKIDWQDGQPTFTQSSIDAEVTKLTFNKVVANKIKELESDYISKNQVPIEYMGTTFQADYKSQDIISRVLTAGSVPADFYWLDITNAKIPMTYAQLQGLAMALLERNQVNFDNLQTQKSAINKATTVEQVQAI